MCYTIVLYHPSVNVDTRYVTCVVTLTVLLCDFSAVPSDLAVRRGAVLVSPVAALLATAI